MLRQFARSQTPLCEIIIKRSSVQHFSTISDDGNSEFTGPPALTKSSTAMKVSHRAVWNQYEKGLLHLDLLKSQGQVLNEAESYDFILDVASKLHDSEFYFECLSFLNTCDSMGMKLSGGILQVCVSAYSKYPNGSELFPELTSSLTSTLRLSKSYTSQTITKFIDSGNWEQAFILASFQQLKNVFPELMERMLIDRQKRFPDVPIDIVNLFAEILQFLMHSKNNSVSVVLPALRSVEVFLQNPSLGEEAAAALSKEIFRVMQCQIDEERLRLTQSMFNAICTIVSTPDENGGSHLSTLTNESVPVEDIFSLLFSTIQVAVRSIPLSRRFTSQLFSERPVQGRSQITDATPENIDWLLMPSTISQAINSSANIPPGAPGIEFKLEETESSPLMDDVKSTVPRVIFDMIYAAVQSASDPSHATSTYVPKISSISSTPFVPDVIPLIRDTLEDYRLRCGRRNFIIKSSDISQRSLVLDLLERSCLHLHEKDTAASGKVLILALQFLIINADTAVVHSAEETVCSETNTAIPAWFRDMMLLMQHADSEGSELQLSATGLEPTHSIPSSNPVFISEEFPKIIPYNPGESETAPIGTLLSDIYNLSKPTQSALDIFTYNLTKNIETKARIYQKPEILFGLPIELPDEIAIVFPKLALKYGKFSTLDESFSPSSKDFIKFLNFPAFMYLKHYLSVGGRGMSTKFFHNTPFAFTPFPPIPTTLAEDEADVEVTASSTLEISSAASAVESAAGSVLTEGTNAPAAPESLSNVVGEPVTTSDVSISTQVLTEETPSEPEPIVPVIDESNPFERYFPEGDPFAVPLSPQVLFGDGSNSPELYLGLEDLVRDLVSGSAYSLDLSFRVAEQLTVAAASSITNGLVRYIEEPSSGKIGVLPPNSRAPVLENLVKLVNILVRTIPDSPGPIALLSSLSNVIFLYSGSAAFNGTDAPNLTTNVKPLPIERNDLLQLLCSTVSMALPLLSNALPGSISTESLVWRISNLYLHSKPATDTRDNINQYLSVQGSTNSSLQIGRDLHSLIPFMNLLARIVSVTPITSESSRLTSSSQDIKTDVFESEVSLRTILSVVLDTDLPSLDESEGALILMDRLTKHLYSFPKLSDVYRSNSDTDFENSVHFRDRVRDGYKDTTFIDSDLASSTESFVTATDAKEPMQEFMNSTDSYIYQPISSYIDGTGLHLSSLTPQDTRRHTFHINIPAPPETKEQRLGKAPRPLVSHTAKLRHRVPALPPSVLYTVPRPLRFHHFVQSRKTTQGRRSLGETRSTLVLAESMRFLAALTVLLSPLLSTPLQQRQGAGSATPVPSDADNLFSSTAVITALAARALPRGGDHIYLFSIADEIMAAVASLRQPVIFPPFQPPTRGAAPGKGVVISPSSSLALLAVLPSLGISPSSGNLPGSFLVATAGAKASDVPQQSVSATETGQGGLSFAELLLHCDPRGVSATSGSQAAIQTQRQLSLLTVLARLFNEHITAVLTSPHSASTLKWSADTQPLLFTILGSNNVFAGWSTARILDSLFQGLVTASHAALGHGMHESILELSAALGSSTEEREVLLKRLDEVVPSSQTPLASSPSANAMNMLFHVISETAARLVDVHFHSVPVPGAQDLPNPLYVPVEKRSFLVNVMFFARPQQALVAGSPLQRLLRQMPVAAPARVGLLPGSAPPRNAQLLVPHQTALALTSARASLSAVLQHFPEKSALMHTLPVLTASLVDAVMQSFDRFELSDAQLQAPLEEAFSPFANLIQPLPVHMHIANAATGAGNRGPGHLSLPKRDSIVTGEEKEKEKETPVMFSVPLASLRFSGSRTVPSPIGSQFVAEDHLYRSSLKWNVNSWIQLLRDEEALLSPAELASVSNANVNANLGSSTDAETPSGRPSVASFFTPGVKQPRKPKESALSGASVPAASPPFSHSQLLQRVVPPIPTLYSVPQGGLRQEADSRALLGHSNEAQLATFPLPAPVVVSIFSPHLLSTCSLQTLYVILPLLARSALLPRSAWAGLIHAAHSQVLNEADDSYKVSNVVSVRAANPQLPCSSVSGMPLPPRMAAFKDTIEAWRARESGTALTYSPDPVQPKPRTLASLILALVLEQFNRVQAYVSSGSGDVTVESDALSSGFVNSPAELALYEKAHGMGLLVQKLQGSSRQTSQKDATDADAPEMIQEIPVDLSLSNVLWGGGLSRFESAASKAATSQDDEGKGLRVKNPRYMQMQHFSEIRKRFPNIPDFKAVTASKHPIAAPPLATLPALDEVLRPSISVLAPPDPLLKVHDALQRPAGTETSTDSSLLPPSFVVASLPLLGSSFSVPSATSTTSTHSDTPFAQYGLGVRAILGDEATMALLYLAAAEGDLKVVTYLLDTLIPVGSPVPALPVLPVELANSIVVLALEKKQTDLARRVITHSRLLHPKLAEFESVGLGGSPSSGKKEVLNTNDLPVLEPREAVRVRSTIKLDDPLLTKHVSKLSFTTKMRKLPPLKTKYSKIFGLKEDKISGEASLKDRLRPLQNALATVSVPPAGISRMIAPADKSEFVLSPIVSSKLSEYGVESYGKTWEKHLRPHNALHPLILRCIEEVDSSLPITDALNSLWKNSSLSSNINDQISQADVQSAFELLRLNTYIVRLSDGSNRVLPLEPSVHILNPLLHPPLAFTKLHRQSESSYFQSVGIEPAPAERIGQPSLLPQRLHVTEVARLADAFGSSPGELRDAGLGAHATDPHGARALSLLLLNAASMAGVHILNIGVVASPLFLPKDPSFLERIAVPLLNSEVPPEQTRLINTFLQTAVSASQKCAVDQKKKRSDARNPLSSLYTTRSVPLLTPLLHNLSVMANTLRETSPYIVAHGLSAEVENTQNALNSSLKPLHFQGDFFLDSSIDAETALRQSGWTVGDIRKRIAPHEYPYFVDVQHLRQRYFDPDQFARPLIHSVRGALSRPYTSAGIRDAQELVQEIELDSFDSKETEVISDDSSIKTAKLSSAAPTPGVTGAAPSAFAKSLGTAAKRPQVSFSQEEILKNIAQNAILRMESTKKAKEERERRDREKWAKQASMRLENRSSGVFDKSAAAGTSAFSNLRGLGWSITDNKVSLVPGGAAAKEKEKEKEKEKDKEKTQSTMFAGISTNISDVATSTAPNIRSDWNPKRSFDALNAGASTKPPSSNSSANGSKGSFLDDSESDVDVESGDESSKRLSSVNKYLKNVNSASHDTPVKQEPELQRLKMNPQSNSDQYGELDDAPDMVRDMDDDDVDLQTSSFSGSEDYNSSRRSNLFQNEHYDPVIHVGVSKGKAPAASLLDPKKATFHGDFTAPIESEEEPMHPLESKILSEVAAAQPFLKPETENARYSSKNAQRYKEQRAAALSSARVTHKEAIEAANSFKIAEMPRKIVSVEERNRMLAEERKKAELKREEEMKAEMERLAAAEHENAKENLQLLLNVRWAKFKRSLPGSDSAMPEDIAKQLPKALELQKKQVTITGSMAKYLGTLITGGASSSKKVSPPPEQNDGKKKK